MARLVICFLSPFLVSIIVEMSGDLVDDDIFLFIGFLRGRVLLSSCLCYNVCRGDGDLRMGGIRASVSYATPPYAGGVVRLLLLIFTASPLLLYPRRSSLLNRPAFLYDRRGDFFLPTYQLHNHCLLAFPCGCRSHLPVRASCVFWGFHMDIGPLAYPSRRALISLSPYSVCYP